MPEVPSAQAPSTEETKLSNEPQPQPSEADLDKAQVQQEKVPGEPDVPHRLETPVSTAPSEGGNVVPVEPVEGLKDPQGTSSVPYEEGSAYSFTAPNGESYTIVVTKVEGQKVTLQNSTPGAAPVVVSLEQAQEILESPART